jgi:hypothetical protein
MRKLILIIKTVFGILMSDQESGINVFIYSDDEIEKREFPIYIGNTKI